MGRGRIFFILAFVLILVLVGFLVVWQFVLRPQTQGGPSAQETAPPSKIVFVARNIRMGATLVSEDLEARDWPANQIDEGMMYVEDDIPELIGRQVQYDLQAGIPLLRNMLLDQGEQIRDPGSPWAHRIPPGSVAVSIPVTRLSSVSYAPRPGDHVNVVVTMMFVDLDTEFQSILPNYSGIVIASGPPNPESGQRDPLTVEIGSLMPRDLPDNTGRYDVPGAKVPGIYGRIAIDPVLGQAVYLVPSEVQRPRLVSAMLLQDITVLQIGNFPLTGQSLIEEPVETPQAGGAQQQQEQPQESTKPDVITLIVTPQDAVTLNYLIYSGAELTLALRNILDVDQLPINPVTLQYLLEQYRIPVPVRLPYGPQPRIDNLNPPVLQNDLPGGGQ